MRFLRLRRLHFVGAGGVGMSGLAEILLLSTPLEISGCDLQRSENTDRLTKLGGRIAYGHDATHVADADLVVISSAIGESSPEVTAARERGIPVIRRAEMLAEIMRLKQGVAIAGTHGKTTTTSLAGMVLTEAGFDPTIVVGGQVRILGTNARLGKGDYLVAEADEFDRSFLELTPVVAVITNIEADHLDCYRDLDDIQDAFATFANRVPFYGAVVLCLDDPGAREIIPRIKRRVVTYGESQEANVRAQEIELRASGTTFEVWEGQTWCLGSVHLRLPGRHNVANALAAIAVGRELSIPFPTIARALSEFTGVIRRFETKGERGGVLVVDDYAHHPTEIAATLASARQVYPDRRLVALFQPHLYSRTRDFAGEFGRVLTAADLAIVTDVYPSREQPIAGVTGELVTEAARSCGHPGVVYVPEKKALAAALDRLLKPGDLLLTMGAGDIVKFGEEYLRRG
ncbi:MAG: UDP-N-acetylmuramate--L-alanine ligase [Acidobacteria bacterium]|nr:UDP-N-acetylmuramate--L-alanine ligase [Acidobacteriota bacterium]MCA1610681.1 UDP-N-acetylmuramate--L-alanine ligase [Acidobacteriota bacterium]